MKVEIRLSPEPTPRVQSLILTSVPEPPVALRHAADVLVASLAERNPRVPAALTLADSIDRSALERELRAEGARFGASAVGPAIAGDGERTATWRCASPAGRFDLALELDPSTGALARAALVPVSASAPHLAD